MLASHLNVLPREGHGVEHMINTERRMYTNTGPLGFQVTITNGAEPKIPLGMMSQDVSPRPSAGREEFSYKNNVHPAVTMFSAQPVAAGTSDPFAVHRWVDFHDKVSLEERGPMSRDSGSEIRQTEVIERSLDKGWNEEMASRSGKSENPDDCSGDRNGARVTYVESDKLAGEWDTLVKQDIDCQLVHVNKGRNDCVTELRDFGGSSDLGVQSWTEQWENMSDNLMDDSYVDTGDLHRNVSSELTRLLYDAPPNTGDEDTSSGPGTDGSGTGVLPKSWPEEILDDDRNLRKDDKPDGEYDSNSEEIIADERNLSNDDKTDSEYDSDSEFDGYSDFSDDSSVVGVRKDATMSSALPRSGTPAKEGLCPGPRDPSGSTSKQGGAGVA